MLWDDQFDFSDVFSEVLVSSELKQSFVSSADGRFPNLRSSTVDPILQLPSSRSNFKIVFTLLNDPQELETQTTLATYICGGILSTKPTTRRAYDSAPARLNRPSLGGEHAVVHLWRKFLGWRYHLRSLEMTCHTDVHPTFTMCLRVPPVMEELRLKFHEKECRLDIDLSTSSQLRTLSLSGAFHLYLGNSTLTNLVKLDLAGSVRAGKEFTSVTPPFLFTILQATPNVEEIEVSLTSKLNAGHPQYPGVSLPRVKDLLIAFGSCTAADVQAILGKLSLSPSLKSVFFEVDIPVTQPLPGQFGITSLIERADASLEDFGFQINQKHLTIHIPEVTDCLRLCPSLGSLILSANVISSEFLSNFTLNGDEETDLCPLLSEITFLGDLSYSNNLFLDMISSRRDSIEKIICGVMHKSSLIKALGSELRFSDYDNQHIEATLSTEDEDTLISDEAMDDAEGKVGN